MRCCAAHAEATSGEGRAAFQCPRCGHAMLRADPTAYPFDPAPHVFQCPRCGHAMLREPEKGAEKRPDQRVSMPSVRTCDAARIGPRPLAEAKKPGFNALGAGMRCCAADTQLWQRNLASLFQCPRCGHAMLRA